MSEITYRDISEGVALEAFLKSKGWSKPRKKDAHFYKQYGEYSVVLKFNYATFRHHPGDFTALPVAVISSPILKKWSKVTLPHTYEDLAPLWSPNQSWQDLNCGLFKGGGLHLPLLDEDGQLDEFSIGELSDRLDQLMAEYQPYHFADRFILDYLDVRGSKMLSGVLCWLRLHGMESKADVLFKKALSLHLENEFANFDKCRDNLAAVMELPLNLFDTGTR